MEEAVNRGIRCNYCEHNFRQPDRLAIARLAHVRPEDRHERPKCRGRALTRYQSALTAFGDLRPLRVKNGRGGVTASMSAFLSKTDIVCDHRLAQIVK